MLALNVRADVRDLARNLKGLERDQIPFATAKTLTAVARHVADAETKALASTFDTPTPFTLKAFAVKGATKTSQTATVFAKDIQAAYLQPYAAGGVQVLGKKRAILTPRDLPLNAYGNIPKGRIAQLRGRPDIFIGEVKTRGGKTIGGVWQRPATTRIGRAGRRGGIRLNATGRLKLLIQFTRPATVTHRFPFETTARATVARWLPVEWNAAIAAALASAR